MTHKQVGTGPKPHPTSTPPSKPKSKRDNGKARPDWRAS